MSEELSVEALSSTRTVMVQGTTKDDAGRPDQDVLELVQENLVKSGVKREQAATVAHKVVAQVSSFHSGPIPPAKEFAAYEQICPGAARDILNMAKDEQAHRARMDMASLRGEVWLQSIAIAAAFGIICIMVAGAIVAAYLGHENLGIAIASGGGLALVTGTIAKMLFLSKKSNSSAAPSPSKTSKKRR